MCLGMLPGIGHDRLKEEVLGPNVERHAEQHQGRAQNPTVPKRQANAQALKQGRTCLS
jgi:hypothetical protein